MTSTALESSGATTGYEAKLWEMADALRGSMDAALYKHVVLGLIFLKYVSDAFEETRVGLEAEIEDGADPEDPDEYRALNIFWVPKEARWSHLQAQARQPTIGQTVDDAMSAIERDNRRLSVSCRRTTPDRLSTSGGLGTSLTWSGISRWGMQSRARRTCSVGSMSISCPASPMLRANAEVSSTPLAAWCGSSSRCWSHTTVGSTTHAVDRRVCSSNRWSSCGLTRPGMATAEKLGLISLSMARSPTTPHGGWRG